ncbi:MAG: sodium/proline symporter PutP [Tissierellales bacterium]|nr:sodium/proline symporter PutP [Tissierellales bacterium]MBN2828110.1 sodium/proline symporter PutP [Tissierellales bacterium]
MDGNIVKILVLSLYLVAMVFIGWVYYKKTSDFSDYVLGGRKLGPWTAALSAQASDMSGWLLIGLPGAAYVSGIEASWIAIGLGLGTYINWKVVAKRLRSYTEIAGDSLTLSDYFENRFRDDTHILRLVSSIVIIVFFSVYTSAQFSAGAKLFETLMGMNYTFALILGAAVIILYTFLGGFMAVSFTDFIQGMLMFFALIIVPFVIVAELGGFGAAFDKLSTVDPHYMSLMRATGGGGAISLIAIVSNMAWGLGYFGQPHILARFMAIGSRDEIKKARLIAMIWVIFSLAAAVMVGVFGRVYITDIADPEKIFMLSVDTLFVPVIAGVLLAAILAASMSTADSQLLVTASSISEDIYKKYIKKDATDNDMIKIGRYAVIGIAVIAVFIAFDPNSSVFGLVSYAWAGLGASFGPLIIASLFWKRANKWGAIAGMISGAVTVILWTQIAKVSSAAIFGLYEIVPAFIVSSIAIYAVSLATKAPAQEILDEFDKAIS